MSAFEGVQKIPYLFAKLIFMELLPTQFTGTGEVAGSVFIQIFRFLNLCLYERDGGDHYEIVKARHQKAGSRIIAGKKVEYNEKEIYPKGESWGLYEYCCCDQPAAIRRYNQQAKAMGYDIVLTPEMLPLKEVAA